MTMRREETGPATDAMLDNYRVLTQETLPARDKRIAELEARVIELEKENAHLKGGGTKT